MATLEDIRVIVQRWTQENDPTKIDDAINDSIEELYEALLEVNPGEYMQRKPIRLLADTDIIPFIELKTTAYLKNNSIALVLLSVHEYQAASTWKEQAGSDLLMVKRQVLQTMHRSASVDRYEPYNDTKTLI